MKTFETNATVTPDGMIWISAPVDLPAGEHRVVVQVEEQVSTNGEHKAFDFPVDSYGSWPEGLSLSREAMYDDDGR